MSSGFAIGKAAEADDELVEAFARLLPQLTSSAPPPTRGRLAEIVASPACEILVARSESGRIIGALTLACYPIPTGLKTWVEDVVVDEAWRRRGIGEALLRAALKRAAERGAKKVDLTSQPHRADARALYEKLGFVLRDTGVFRRIDPA